MNSNALIRFVVAICMIAGLSIAPTSFAGLTKHAPAMHDAMAGMVTSDNGEMPCCPKKPVLPDCPKCPLMALCASVFVGQDTAVNLTVPQSVARQREMVSDELLFAGLTGAPLPEPPRSSV
ncbi:hypothetical protein [Beijerinckia sp. L45]|uniref:hypothetical protein n=1 Tax=Beijerinckia sp. L45 TaxID=1641855 RepID=UPI00131CFBA8|nr:hypothetical protein [Beijerinckia sp. L45]